MAGGGPGTEVIEGEFAQGKEEVPEVGGESGVDSSKGGNNMIFGSLDGAFGGQGTVVIGGGECNGDVILLEEGADGSRGFIVDVEVKDRGMM